MNKNKSNSFEGTVHEFKNSNGRCWRCRGMCAGHMVRNGEDVTFIDPWPDHVDKMNKSGLELRGVTKLNHTMCRLKQSTSRKFKIRQKRAPSILPSFQLNRTTQFGPQASSHLIFPNWASLSRFKMPSMRNAWLASLAPNGR